MADRVTIQDIADALGLSRNTVSKAINNTGILADATRERILQKAIELGYKQFSYVSSVAEALPQQNQLPANQGEIALFSTMFLDHSHFASTMVDKFQGEIASKGYSLTLHRVNPDHFKKMALPFSFHAERTKAIICFEIFDYKYAKMLCSLGIPVLFVDGPVEAYTNPLPADVILMNNTTGIFNLVSNLKGRGITRIGFIGEIEHCMSFMERFMAFRNAMFVHGLAIEDKFCFTSIDTDPHVGRYQPHITSLGNALSSLDELPEVFICANDFVALDTLALLRQQGYDCPKDVWLVGFDDSPGSRIMMPTLTTCHIHSQIMGYAAAHQLLTRIQQPFLNYTVTYAETEMVYRESTMGEE